MKESDLPYTYLMRKLAMDIECSTVPAICCWSDLLGFGGMVSENNWKPDKKGWMAIANRLRNAQSFCIQSYGTGEYIFVSNDGFIRNLDLSREPGHIQFFSIWFRGLIWYHISINSMERKQGYPGTRTIVAGGERLLHNWDKFTSADLLYHFEGRDIGPDSSYSRREKEIIMENPLPLQMNTAFSKAYILDSGGSKQGLPGNNFYIEQSVLDLLIKYARTYHEHCDEYIWEEDNNKILFAIPHRNNVKLHHLGFELTKPIPFNYKGVKTNVYKVDKFYPWDEDPQEFCIPLNDDHIYFVSLDTYKDFFPDSKSTLNYPKGLKHMGYDIDIVEVNSLDCLKNQKDDK